MLIDNDRIISNVLFMFIFCRLTCVVRVGFMSHLCDRNIIVF